MIAKDLLDAIETILQDAESFCHDLDTGLEDGTYEEGQERLEGSLEAALIVDTFLGKERAKLSFKK